MIKLYYPKFWQSRSVISFILLPFGMIFLLLGYLRKLLAKPVKFPAFTICVGNATIGGTGKTQIIITLAKEFAKRNINFIILSKAYRGNCSVATLVTASSSAEEVGDEALELCRYGNSFVVPCMKDALTIIQKYKPDVILVDDGMQNPGFHKDLVIMTIDGSRGFGNGLPIPAGPMRSMHLEAMQNTDIIVINGKAETELDLDKSKPVFNAYMLSNHNFGSNKYYAFAGIGNPEKFFAFLKHLGAELRYTKIFPDHHKYSTKDIEFLVNDAKKKKLRLITTRKDYVKIQTPEQSRKMPLIPALQFIDVIKDSEKPEMSLVEYLEVELELNDSEKFFQLLFSKIQLAKEQSDKAINN